MSSDSHHRIDSFEKIAPYYDLLLDILTFGKYARFLGRGIEILNPKNGQRILDLCSGTGRAASWIAQAVGKKGEVIGMDIAGSMVGVATKQYGESKNVIFIKKDVTEPWGYEDYFDGIFTSFAIHELPEKKRLGALEHSYLALKEGGKMVIADFNPQASGRGKAILLAFFKLFEKENLNFFSFDQNRILRELGFKRIRSFRVLSGLLQITIACRNQIK